jgi:hypothetical protein
VRAAWVVARLVLCESWRSRLWLLALVGCVALLALTPSLRTAAEADRLRLAVASVSGLITFVTAISAALAAATGVRRDLESRTSLMLFGKPMARGTWLAGRWLGALLVAGAGGVVLALAGSLCVPLAVGRQPELLHLQAPAQLLHRDGWGQPVALSRDGSPLTLAGRAGDRVELRFDGLPAGRDTTLLLKADVMGFRGGGPLGEARVVVTASLPDGTTRLLQLAPDSPYGSGLEIGTLEPGQIALRRRGVERTAPGHDYARLQLPAAAVASNGQAQVTVTRVDREASLAIDRELGVLVAQPGRPLVVELLLALTGGLAGAAVVAAAAAALAVVGNLGVALFGTGVLLFAGSIAGFLLNEGRLDQLPLAIERSVRLALSLLPDLDRAALGGVVAGARSLELAAVAGAWLSLAPHLMGLLLLGWWALARKEL